MTSSFIIFAVNNVEVTVFLVSLKAGGVALNLTEASRVYLMDSWWNPAVSFYKHIDCHPCRLTSIKVEYRMISSSYLCNFLIFLAEAMDRIHRLGQRRPVQAIKLVIEDSIESRIVQVCPVSSLRCRTSVNCHIFLVAGKEECDGGCDVIS